jgi:hypothetical protein
MSNPGPAVTIGLHPQNLTSAQALRLIGQVKGVNIAATGDTAIPVIDSSLFIAKELIVTNANNSGNAAPATLAYVTVNTATNTNGTSLFGNVSLANSTVTPTNYVEISNSVGNTANSAVANVTNLYFNVNTVSGNAGTVDVYVYGYDLSQTL